MCDARSTMALGQRLSLALFVTFLHLGCSGAKEISSANGWLLVATQHSDATNIVFQCELLRANSTVRAEMACPHELSWFEGFTRIQDPWRVSQGGVSRVNLTVSATSFGKYTCQVMVDNEELAVSVWVVPEGGTSELIREELYSIGEMFTVNCSGNLLQICLSNQCGEMHNSTYTGNVSSLSDQFKFICFADGNQVANIAYIMPDYQPIRLLQPQTQQLWPEAYDRVVIRCEATGHPAPNVSILKWDDSENDFIGVITYPNDLIAYSTSNVSYVIKGYSKFFDPGRYMCSAENLYEQRNVTVYVGEENPNNSCGTTPIPSMTPPTPVHNDTIKVDIRMVPVVQVGDLVRIECTFALGADYFTSNSMGVWWIREQLTTYSPVSPDSVSREGMVTKTLTIENVSLSDAGEYTCQFDVVGTSTRGSGTAQLQVVAEELVSVFGNLSSLDVLLVTGPTDGATNFSILFRVHADIVPMIAAYPLMQDSVAGYLLQAITLEPQWAQWESNTRAVWVELQPSRLANISLRLQEQHTNVLLLNVSYYTHSAVAFLNVTFLPPSISPVPGEDQSGLVGGLTTLMVLLLVMVSAVCALVVLSCVYRRRWEHRVQSKHVQLELVESPEIRLRRKILKEVSRELLAARLLYRQEDLTVGETLGEGAFGLVCKGSLVLSSSTISVAVKTIKDATRLDALEEFVKELKMLQRIGQHRNIISLVGAVIKDDALNILTEYAEGGKLLSHLHQQRRSGLPWHTKVDYSLQVARGMDYLAQMQCVHCDLAARNVLLMHDGTLKVSDFGLARKLYQELYHKNVSSRTRLPLKWMALESIEKHDFDSQTDVWSFGVLLWEIATLGQTPYPLWSIKELVSRLRNGERLPRPRDCPECLYTVMRSCWLPSAEDRPKFAQLVAMLQEIVVGVLPQELESESNGLPVGTNPVPMACSSYTTYQDSANVRNDVTLDSSTGGYCSYCQPRALGGEEAEGEDASCAMPPEQSIQLRALPQITKMSARRLDSADSGICRNGESDLGSTSSIAVTHSAYSTGQSSTPCCTGHTDCSCGGAYTSGCTYTNSRSSHGNPFGGLGSGVTFNGFHHPLPGHTSVHPNSLSVRHIFREQLPTLRSGVTESDV